MAQLDFATSGRRLFRLSLVGLVLSLGMAFQEGLLVDDHLTLGAIVNPPYLYACAVHNITQCNGMPGIEYDFMKFLAELLRFTFDIREATTEGHNATNFSSYDALLMDLESGAVNMSLSFLTIQQQNEELDCTSFADHTCPTLAYSSPIIFYRKSYLIREPSNTKIEFLLTLPFGKWVWTTFLAMIPAYFLTLTLMAVVFHDRAKFRTISHNAWTILGSMVKPVRPGRLPKHSAHRSLMLSWQLGKTILLSLYSASMVGFLFIPTKPNLPFETTEEALRLVTDGRLRFVELFGRNFLLSQYSRNSSVRDGMESVLAAHPPLYFNHSEEAVRYVAEHSDAVLAGYDLQLRIWTQLYNVCTAYVVEDESAEKHMMALAFPETFKYAETIRRMTADVAASYYMHKLTAKYVAPENLEVCRTDREREEEFRRRGGRTLVTLTLNQMQGSFWIVAIGAASGMVAFGYEILRRRRARKKFRKAALTMVPFPSVLHLSDDLFVLRM